MKDMMCVATFAGMDSKPLVLEVRHFELRENGELEVQAYWDMSEQFLDIAHRGYDKLSIAWYNADKSPNADKINGVTYTSSTPFRITGVLNYDAPLAEALEFALATIWLNVVDNEAQP